MSKGLITIATGNIHYYKIAANLLLSYRMFTKNPFPFSIIAEEENEYTKLFDNVILTTEARHSFLDKFLLLKLSPYDETIFFDADCLAYGDLNNYWDFFKDATDFSAPGKNCGLNDEFGAWYNIDGIGEYANQITYKTSVHLGVCYIKKSAHITNLYKDCMELQSNYNKLHFHSYPNSIDECIMGLAMPMNNMKAIQSNINMLAAYPCLTKLKADILNKKLSYTTEWGASSSQGILLHWGTAQTYKPLYRFNEECLHIMCKNDYPQISIKEKLLYVYKLRLFPLYVFWIATKTVSITKKIIKKLFKLMIQMFNKIKHFK